MPSVSTSAFTNKYIRMDCVRNDPVLRGDDYNGRYVHPLVVAGIDTGDAPTEGRS